MFSKKILTTLCIMITALTHGAAGAPKTALIMSLSKPSIHEFIGLASNKAGSCMMRTPEHIEPGKDFPITVVYTEMPELKSEETLSNIVAMFATANQSPNFGKEQFDTTLLEMIEKHAIQTKIVGETCYKFNLDAIILCIKLSQSGVDSYASYPEYESVPKLEYGLATTFAPYITRREELAFCEWHDGRGHAEYDEPLSCSPQEHVDAKLRSAFFASFIKFAFVLDIAEFRERLATASGSNANERERAEADSSRSIPLPKRE